MSVYVEDNVKPDYDEVMQSIADYVLSQAVTSNEAYETARYCLMDAMGCGILALSYPECTKLLGPIVPGATLNDGVPIPGTDFQLDPVQAAFNIGAMVRWLDFNDTWLAAEWGHPSDNLGAILSVAYYVSKNFNENSLTMADVLTAMIKAYEIQGVIALENSFNRVGLDHVLLVKLASAAVIAQILGADRDQLLRTLSQVFVDGQSLRTYRHAPNAGSRKSWAAGDACARAVQLALISKKGEMGYPSALTVPTWGFYDVLFKGKSFSFQRDFGSYVMENILLKLSYPAEFHAQTAVECAVQLHPELKERFDDLEQIQIETHESAIRIISKQGALHNPADRDHCLQYMVAISLLKGDLHAEDYEDDVASDPRIDLLRTKMVVKENKQFSEDYLDPEKRSIANCIKLIFKDGSESEPVCIEYPIGHKRRRSEGIPVLLNKLKNNLLSHYDKEQTEALLDMFKDHQSFAKMPVCEFMTSWKKS
jgi:2-methylcitrate dehydratase